MTDLTHISTEDLEAEIQRRQDAMPTVGIGRRSPTDIGFDLKYNDEDRTVSLVAFDREDKKQREPEPWVVATLQPTEFGVKMVRHSGLPDASGFFTDQRGYLIAEYEE